MRTPVASATLEAYLTKQRCATDAAIARVLDSIAGETRVSEAVRYALSGDGKRLRPALCAASFEAVSGRDADQRVTELGAAVELIHTYSLVHDDLPGMDDDDMRRGRATTHRVFGEGVAMLAGIALIPIAFGTADHAAEQLGLSVTARSEVARTLARAAGAAGMVGGQVMDLAGDARAVDLARLERIHAAKTGALLSAACVLGGMGAHATDEQLRALGAYGRHLGLAFQITDDMLDETASSEQLGKTAGKDRALARATFPALIGLAGASERAGGELNHALGALRRAAIASETLQQLGRFAVERKQ